jgi:hypothetical protein
MISPQQIIAVITIGARNVKSKNEKDSSGKARPVNE